MSLANLVRYALSDLRHRALTTSLNVGAVALAAAYVLVLGFYGASIHRHQREVLERSLPTRITATPSDVTDTRLFFSEERIASLSALDGVALVLPRIELSVRVGLDPSRVVDVPAEGTVPGDPALAPHRLAWGAAIGAEDAREVVLPLGLFERLGGVLREGPGGAAAPVPDRLVLEVGRTVGGTDEVRRLELRVAGLLGPVGDERVHVPIALLRRLDLWCASKIETLDERAVRPRVRHAAAWAWSPVEHAARVPAEVEHLRVEAEPHGEVEVVTTRGPVYAVVERGDGAPLGDQDVSAVRRALGTGRILESVVGTLGDATVAVLDEDDPRLADAPLASRPDALRYGVLTEAGRRAVAGAGELVELVELDLPVDADVVCDALAWRRLVFDARASDGVVPVSVVATDAPEALAAVAGFSRAAPPGPSDGGWVFVRTDALERPSLAPRRDELAARATWTAEEVAARRLATGDPRLDAGAWASGLRELSPDPVAPPRPTPVRWIPSTLFDALCRDGRRARLGAGALHVAPDAAAAPSTLYAPGGRRLRVEDTIVLPGAGEQVWLPGHRPREFGRAEGLVVWGRASGLFAFVDAARRAGWTLDREHGRLPSALVAVAEGDVASVTRRLGPEVAGLCTLAEHLAVPTRTARGATALLVPHEPPRDELLARRPDEALVLQAGSWTSAPRRVLGDESLPFDLVRVPEALFEEAAWHSATHATPLAGARRVELVLDDPVARLTAARRLEEHGLLARPVVEPRVETWRRYRLRDLAGDGSVDEELLDVVRMSPPTFVAAVPDADLRAELVGAGTPLVLTASRHDDPRRFAAVPVAGRWLPPGGGIDQVVLARSLVESTPGLRREDLVGRSITVRVARAAMGGAEETLGIPLEVVGVAPGESSFVPTGLVASVELWRDGKLVFNDTRGTFESPAEIDARQGEVRGTVFASSPEHVEPVVSTLRRMGYETRDELAEQEGLRRLGRVLAFIVAVFVLGAVVNAAITVAVATMMNVKSKIFEIGILRAHGLRRGQILGIFAAQGLIIGASAFVMATGAVLLLEPTLRGVVRQVFGLDDASVLAGSPFDARFWWLSATTLAVAVVFSVGGVLLPAADACRLAPVEALRRRE